MALITLIDASLAFGHVALLDHADFALETSERIGLIGRNGTGKSSFLKILAGMEYADDGNMHVQQGVRIAYVAQEPLLEDLQPVKLLLILGISYGLIRPASNNLFFSERSNIA
jgi:ATPase subunit of ABC transporter with duplicated ATPase domains